MIYLITGAPGSGKTLYAVSTLVQSLTAQKLTDSKGVTVPRRLVVDGVPDLVIPHERLCTPEKDERDNYTCTEGDSVLNWPDWCQKGDVIVIDEVQRYWRPRGMGSKPPRMIAELETHRHKGIDFVIITQSPMLMDQNVRRLIYQHQHIRRILGGQRAVIYEWDSCAADVSRVKSAQSTKYWGYPKSAYSLYKSSELHTKPKVKIPLWLGVPVLAVLGGLFAIPQAVAVMGGVTNGKGIASNSASTPAKPTIPGHVVTMPSPAASAESAATVAALPLQIPQPPPEFNSVGCVRIGAKCGCFDSKGVTVEVKPERCETVTGADRPPAIELGQPAGEPAKYDPSEAGVLAFAFGPKNKPAMLQLD